MSFEQFYREKVYLIKAAIKELKIKRNFDEFFQLGTIALFEASNTYNAEKDKNKNFDSYAYFCIINKFKNELRSQNRYIEYNIDTTRSEYLTINEEQEILTHIEFEKILRSLPMSQYRILQLKLKGYGNTEICKVLKITEAELKYEIKKAYEMIRKMMVN